MPRAQRTVELGGYYHAFPVGNDGREIFADELDRYTHIELVTTVALRHGWQILGYCQMTTHYHIVFRLPKLGLSEGMRWLQARYSRHWNKRHGREGHLFAQHFAGCCVESEAHLRNALRYADCNPLDIAGIEHPAQWPWSSYRAHVGLEHPPAYLDLAGFHQLFGDTPADACRVYEDYVRERRDEVSDTRVGALAEPVSDTVG